MRRAAAWTKGVMLMLFCGALFGCATGPNSGSSEIVGSARYVFFGVLRLRYGALEDISPRCK